LRLKRHNQFLKDLKKVKMTDAQFQKYVEYLALLAQGNSLPPEAKDHPLQGSWQGFREFHLGGDLLVIYRIAEKDIVIARIGSHCQLFE
jgi:mRNA interferase YafQ